MTDDAELLLRYARERSETAFAELVRRHIDLVYSAAARRVGGDSHRAGEVTQEVFLSVARRAEALAGHPVLAAWLHTSTRNAAANLLRTERRRDAREKQILAMNETDALSRPSPEWHQLRSVLDAAVDELADQDRRAVILRFFEGRSYAELGALLALREEAARMRVARAVEKLRVRLARRGITSTGAALAAALTGQAVSAAPGGLAASVTGAVMTAAPAAGLSAAGLVQLMTTTKTVLALGSAAVLVVAGMAVRSQLGAGRLEAELADTNRSYAAASDHLADLRHQAKIDGQAQVQAGPAGAQHAAVAMTPGAANAQELMLHHPEIRQAWEDLQKASSGSGARNLVKASSLNLTAEQYAQLLKIMAMGNSINQAYNADGKSYEFKIDAGLGRDAGREPALTALLGGEGQRRELVRTFDSRNLASDLAAASVAQSVPLTSVQVRQIAQILADNSPTYQQGGSAAVGSINWDGVATQAQGLLSPAQQAVLAQERRQVQFNVTLRAAVAAAPK